MNKFNNTIVLLLVVVASLLLLTTSAAADTSDTTNNLFINLLRGKGSKKSSSESAAAPSEKNPPAFHLKIDDPQQFPINEDENPFKYSGFIEVNSTYKGQMYYVFSEALSGKADSPIIIWLQGGPGASSMFGLFVENGPYNVDSNTLKLVKNPTTWNYDYHMIWLDNPLGSGFSHVESKGYVHSEERVAAEVHIFLGKFFQLEFARKYKANPLYLFGESYAGKVFPSIAYNIMNSGFPFNLVGIGIGDGLTDPEIQFDSYDTYSFATGLLDERQRAIAKQYQSLMVKMIREKKFIDCMNVNNNLTDFIINQCAGGVNVYDIRQYGDDPNLSTYVKYLNLPQTKVLMHTEGVKYYDENTDVWNNLLSDIAKSVKYKVEALLDCPDRKFRVLLYNGQFDWIVNYVGANNWIQSMKWHGADAFNQDSGLGRKPWKIDGQIVGYSHQYDNLVQILVNKAGHMSPMNQGKNVLEMVRTFTQNKNF